MSTELSLRQLQDVYSNWAVHAICRAFSSCWFLHCKDDNNEYRLTLNWNISASLSSCVYFLGLSQQVGGSPGLVLPLPLDSTRQRGCHHFSDNCRHVAPRLMLFKIVKVDLKINMNLKLHINSRNVPTCRFSLKTGKSTGCRSRGTSSTRSSTTESSPTFPSSCSWTRSGNPFKCKQML